MGQNLYERMLQDVEILGRGQQAQVGDPAFETTADRGVAYTPDKYKNSDAINVGISGTFPIPAATTLQLPQPNISNPFKTLRVTIPSSVAEFLLITQMEIAAVNLLDGVAIAADIFSEVSLNNEVTWPTLQTGQNLKVSIQNADPADAHQPRFTLSGLRIRA